MRFTKHCKILGGALISLLLTGMSPMTMAESKPNIDAEMTTANQKDCPEFLNVEFRKLHSKEKVNLCELYQGKPMLFVNTASHCGFTPQFKELEGLYRRYKDKGLQVVGFASNDFNQAAKSEKKAAGICFKNYGVTFTMLAPTKVKGDGANPTFQYLARKSQEPQWNFNKYLIGPDFDTVVHYESKVNPLNSELESQVKKLVF